MGITSLSRMKVFFQFILLSLHQQIIKNMIYDPETDRHYLSEFHKKNSEEAMRILSKQKPLSREEKEAQIERIHKAIDKE